MLPPFLFDEVNCQEGLVTISVRRDFARHVANCILDGARNCPEPERVRQLEALGHKMGKASHVLMGIATLSSVREPGILLIDEAGNEEMVPDLPLPPRDRNSCGEAA